MYLESQFSNVSKRKKISEDEKFLNRIIICDEEWLLYDGQQLDTNENTEQISKKVIVIVW